jgi:hypothetical protein
VLTRPIETAEESPHQALERIERVCLRDTFIAPPSEHSRKADCDAAAMTRRGGNRLEPELEDVDRLHDANRTMPFTRVPPDPPIQLVDLGIRET